MTNTSTPAVLVTGSDNKGNEFCYFKIFDGRWCDSYNESETSPEFVRKYVFPNVIKVYFADLVMTGTEWVENGCPMEMTSEQIQIYKSENAPRPVDEAQRIEREIDSELGTHVIISGGEALELSSYTSGDSDIPF